MPDQVKNILIGVFVLAALAIFTFTLLFLHPRLGDESQRLEVRFANIDKISVGTHVTFAGRPVGEVIAIDVVDAPRTEKYFGDLVYPYSLKLAIDSKVHVYNSDEFALRTSGLLGERSVAITPRKPKRGIRLRRIESGDVIFASEGGSIEETFAEFNDFAERAEEAFDAVMDMVDEIKQHNLIENIGKAAENLADITGALNTPRDWSDTLANVRGFSEKLNTFTDRALETWDNVDETVGNMVSMSEDFVAVASDTREVTAKTAQGQGTIGRLFSEEDLYLRLTSILNKGETIADDINHYGLLFQNDEHWQRLRARRMNLMFRLRTPQQFSNFFNDEVDEISTSLYRLSSVMQKMNCACPPYDLMQNREFSYLFADFLRRIQGLEESIKLYNQQLIDVHRESECGQ